METRFSTRVEPVWRNAAPTTVLVLSEIRAGRSARVGPRARLAAAGVADRAGSARRDLTPLARATTSRSAWCRGLGRQRALAGVEDAFGQGASTRAAGLCVENWSDSARRARRRANRRRREQRLRGLPLRAPSGLFFSHFVPSTRPSAVSTRGRWCP